MEQRFAGTIELKTIAGRSREVHTFIEQYEKYLDVLGHAPGIALVTTRTHKAIEKAIAEYNKRDGFLTGLIQIENLRIEGNPIEVHETRS
jgi:hypothetical protein